MAILRYLDDPPFEVRTKTGAMARIWQGQKFRLHATLGEFLEANAHALREFYGVRLRTLPEEQFDDLVAAGLLTVVRGRI